jgi:D-glycerate 3-kinase
MSLPAGQVEGIRKAAAQWLQAQSSLQPTARNALAKLTPALLYKLQESRSTTLAIAGPPGSGKSTLAKLLAHLLATTGKVATVLSLDNYYFGHSERLQLAHDLHPLLQMRGVPGTHNWEALLHDFDRLRSGQIRGLTLPVFNKSTDDQEPRSRWHPIEAKPDYVIIEGWCIGAPEQADRDLEIAVNELENSLDPLATWRRYVNGRLALYHADLRKRFEQFWYLQVPDWDCVIEWRWQQEQELPRRLLASREETRNFLATYERIVLHMLKTSRDWADYRLDADRSHCLRASGSPG